MKRKFKHKKLLKVNIEIIEHEWYSKFNKEYYKKLMLIKNKIINKLYNEYKRSH